MLALLVAVIVGAVAQRPGLPLQSSSHWNHVQQTYVDAFGERVMTQDPLSVRNPVDVLLLHEHAAPVCNRTVLVSSFMTNQVCS